MKAWILPVLILLAGCASKPPPRVAFLYKGMSKDLMLQIMGDPVQIVTAYPGQDAHPQAAHWYQYSNAKCVGETHAVCTVWLTENGVVYGWQGIKPEYTEDGQK